MAKKSFIKVSSCALATLLMFSNFINCSAQSEVKHDIKKGNSRVGLKVAAGGAVLAVISSWLIYKNFNGYKFKYMPKNDEQRCFGALWNFIFTTGLGKEYLKHMVNHTGKYDDGKDKVCPSYCVWGKRLWYGENTKLRDLAVRFFERFDKPGASISEKDISEILGTFKLGDLKQIFEDKVFNNELEMSNLGLNALCADESAQNRQTFEYFCNYGFNNYMLWNNERGLLELLCYGKEGIFEKFRDDEYLSYYETLWKKSHPNVTQKDNLIYQLWFISCHIDYDMSDDECVWFEKNKFGSRLNFSFYELDQAIQFINSHPYVPSKDAQEQNATVEDGMIDNSNVYEEVDGNSISDIHICNLAVSLFESCKNIDDDRLNDFRALVDDCKSGYNTEKLDLDKLRNKFKINSEITIRLGNAIRVVRNVLAENCESLKRVSPGTMSNYLDPRVFRENMRSAWENKFQVSLLDKFFSSDFKTPSWRSGKVPQDCSAILLGIDSQVTGRSTSLEQYVKPIMERLCGYQDIRNQNSSYSYEGNLMVNYLFGHSRYGYRLPALASENVNCLIYHIATWLNENMLSENEIIKEAIESFKLAFVATNGNCANELLCLLHQWMIIIDDVERKLGRYECDDITNFTEHVFSAVRSKASENMMGYGKLMEKTQTGCMGQENRNALRKEHALGLNVPFIVERGGKEYDDIDWNERRNAFVSCVTLTELFGTACNYFGNVGNKHDLINSCKEIKLTYGQFCGIFDNSNIQNGARLPGWNSIKDAYDNIFSKKFSQRFSTFLNSLDKNDHNVQNLQKWFDGKVALNPEDLADIIQNIPKVDTKNVPEINKYNARYNDDTQAQYFGRVLFPIYLFDNGCLAISD